jgi:hypothetical protein
MLEALPAKDGPALRWFEGNGGLFSAGGTVGPSFHAGPRSWRGHRSQRGIAFGLARLATFGRVLELLIVKKKLFAGREDEVSAAINAL